LKEEGLIVDVTRTPEGKIERTEGRRVPPDMRYEFDSMDEIEFFKSVIAKTLRHQAAERAARDGRSLVTLEDVRAS
jgi:hypothetical protein